MEWDLGFSKDLEFGPQYFKDSLLGWNHSSYIPHQYREGLARINSTSIKFHVKLVFVIKRNI